jgi:hypothetical protein
MSDADVKARLRTYRDAAQRREVSPDAWPRLERRLRREPWRRAALAAAAVALVVGVAAVGTDPIARWAERQPATVGAPGRPTVAARIPLGCPPGTRSLGVGFGAVWVACDGVLLRIDPAANRIAAVIPLEGGVADIGFSDDWVWVASGSSAHPVVYQIDPVRNVQVISTPVPPDPSGMVIADGVAWVIGDGAEPDTLGPARVVRLDADTGARLSPIQLPSPPVRIRSGFGAIWVSTERAVYRIDPRTLIRTRVPRAQDVVAAGPDSLWVTADNPSTGIHRIDPANGRVLATIPVPVKEIRALALGQGALWVSTTAELYRLDPGDARVVGAPVPLEAPSVALAVGEGGIWVLESGRETFIARLDPTP